MSEEQSNEFVKISLNMFKKDKEYLEKNNPALKLSVYVREIIHEFVEGDEKEKKRLQEVEENNRELKEMVEQLQFTVQSMEEELRPAISEIMEMQKKRTNLKLQKLRKPPGVE